MLQTRLLIALLVLFFSGAAVAYDAERAQHFERLYAPFTDLQTGRSLARIPIDDFVNLIKSGAEIQILDVRTPAEINLMPYGGALTLQMSEVFLPENLAQLPTDRPIIVVCQTGLRNTMIAIALRDIGFENARALFGGMRALANHITVANAHAPVPQN